MSREFCRKNLYGAVLAVIGMVACHQERPSELGQLWKEAKQQVEAVDWSEDTSMAELEENFRSVLKQSGTAQVLPILGLWSWRVQPVATQFIQVAPRRTAAYWQGFYLIRRSSNCLPILLQAPHVFFDKGTGRLAMQLFESGLAKALSMNTVHRKQIDLAHHQVSAFNAFTEAFVGSFEPAYVVQLHGFAEAKRSDARARSALAIVSSGSSEPSAFQIGLVNALRRSFGEQILLFPRDVQELGGLKNIQAERLRQISRVSFTHIELSSAFRRQLLTSRALRNKFMMAFEETLAK